MAYSKTPTGDTYSQEDITITREWTSRQNDPTGVKDETFINCFVEVVKDRRLQDSRLFVFKRAGSKEYHQPAATGDIRGFYYWTDVSKLFYCVNGVIYIYNVVTDTVGSVSVFSTTSGSVGFTPFLYTDGTSKLVVSDGTQLATVDQYGTVVMCSDADLPTPHLPKPIFLDGYIFLAKKDTADIYNSDLNDPLAWTAGNFISAEMEADVVKDIEKLNNYLVVFGSATIEYFWDAANDTGSPLKRNDTPVKINGFIGGLSKSGNALYYLGYNSNESVDLFKLQDFTIEEQSSETIRRYLNTLNNTTTTYSGTIVSNLGHLFYILNAGTNSYAYDLKEKFWSKWKYQQTSKFDINKAITFPSPTGTKTIFCLSGSPTFYAFDDTVYRDNLVDFTLTIITEPADFGTMNRKSMGRLSIVCDRPPATSNVYISFSDDDFQSWYGNYPVNIDQDLPSINRCGSFRQRAIKLTYTDNYPLRIQKIQVNINKGRT